MENDNLKEKVKFKIAISKIKENTDITAKRNTYSITKKIAIVACFVFAFTGVGFATQTVVEKIWKEPESHGINKEITDKERSEAISEEKARKIAEDYLQKIGIAKNITTLTLKKDVVADEVLWLIGFENGMIEMDNKGEIQYINIPSWSYKIPYNYGITREVARKVAKELLEKYNPNDDSEKYELVSLKRNAEKDEDAYIWYAEFSKKYGNLLNNYETINIGWIPTINGLYNLGFKTSIYENNEQIISEEDAKKIALEKDKQIETKKTIKSTKAEIRIEQMNTEVYYREKHKEEYEYGKLNMEQVSDNSYKLKDDAVFYKTEKRVRKVWEVVIEYDVEKSLKEYTYFIDATTGEIIGGQKGDKLITDEQIYNDPYNVIEK